MAAEPRFATAGDGEVPPGDAWLGPRERAVLEGMAFPARRASFRLGRFTAKRLLGDGVELLPSAEGPPRAFRGDERLPLSVSLSHRAGLAICAAADGAVALGCDVELVEPRSPAFVAEFLTAAEQAAVAAARDRALHANLVWSAKESALKALHVGLGRDTRELEVQAGAGGELSVTDLSSGRALRGFWRRLGDHVLTLVADLETTS